MTPRGSKGFPLLSTQLSLQRSPQGKEWGPGGSLGLSTPGSLGREGEKQETEEEAS